MALTDIKKQLIAALVRAAHDPKAEFRSVGLSTFGRDAVPKSRMVVLRSYDPQAQNAVFYTDKRTPKVAEILENPAVSLLFYDRRHKIQIRAEGDATLVFLKQENAQDPVFKIWQGLSTHGRQDYQTSAPPGSLLDEGDLKEGEPLGHLSKTAENFCLITVKIRSFDWLSLSRDGHKRASFTVKDGDLEGRFLIP